MSQTLQIIGSIFLAAIPALIWGYIFYKKNPAGRDLTIITFMVGALAVFPILFYKFLWAYFPHINIFKFAAEYSRDVIGLTDLTIIPLSILITFLFVGVIEEIMKMISVKFVDSDEFNSVDDAIEFFIIAALGFSFTENILYFYNIWVTQGGEQLLLPFLFRSSFSTLAHVIFSGVLGYYYGVSHFAAPILQQEIRKNRKHWTVILHKLFKFDKETLFYEERILEGLLVSIGLHAIFNILLEINLTFLIVPFLVGGYIALNYLFDKRENHRNYKSFLSRCRHRISKMRR